MGPGQQRRQDAALPLPAPVHRYRGSARPCRPVARDGRAVPPPAQPAHPAAGRGAALLAPGHRDRRAQPRRARRLPLRPLHRHAPRRGSGAALGAGGLERDDVQGRGDRDRRAAGATRHPAGGGDPRTPPRRARSLFRAVPAVGVSVREQPLWPSPPDAAPERADRRGGRGAVLVPRASHVLHRSGGARAGAARQPDRAAGQQRPAPGCDRWPCGGLDHGATARGRAAQRRIGSTKVFCHRTVDEPCGIGRTGEAHSRRYAWSDTSGCRRLVAPCTGLWQLHCVRWDTRPRCQSGRLFARCDQWRLLGRLRDHRVSGTAERRRDPSSPETTSQVGKFHGSRCRQPSPRGTLRPAVAFTGSLQSRRTHGRSRTPRALFPDAVDPGLARTLAGGQCRTSSELPCAS